MQFPQDGALARDVVTVNPHFFGDNPSALLNSLNANLLAWPGTSTASWTLKAYDAEKPKPNYPVAIIERTGTIPGNDRPREIALCLSYYTGFNRPSYRGRLYLPTRWLTGQCAQRPSATQKTEVLSFGQDVLSKNLPASHNWVVWSAKYKKSQGGVSNIWVDDEWDTVRSRGLRPTSRITATVP
jgi:hypothetical protein